MWDSSKTAAAAATKTYATSLQLELRYLRFVMLVWITVFT
jgi:hypothetical protein